MVIYERLITFSKSCSSQENDSNNGRRKACQMPPSQELLQPSNLQWMFLRTEDTNQESDNRNPQQSNKSRLQIIVPSACFNGVSSHRHLLTYLQSYQLQCHFSVLVTFYFDRKLRLAVLVAHINAVPSHQHLATTQVISFSTGTVLLKQLLLILRAMLPANAYRRAFTSAAR